MLKLLRKLGLLREITVRCFMCSGLWLFKDVRLDRAAAWTRAAKNGMVLHCTACGNKYQADVALWQKGHNYYGAFDESKAQKIGATNEELDARDRERRQAAAFKAPPA